MVKYLEEFLENYQKKFRAIPVEITDGDSVEVLMFFLKQLLKEFL